MSTWSETCLIFHTVSNQGGETENLTVILLEWSLLHELISATLRPNEGARHLAGRHQRRTINWSTFGSWLCHRIVPTIARASLQHATP